MRIASLALGQGGGGVITGVRSLSRAGEGGSPEASSPLAVSRPAGRKAPLWAKGPPGRPLGALTPGPTLDCLSITPNRYSPSHARGCRQSVTRAKGPYWAALFGRAEGPLLARSPE
eukprot:13961834-Alexandrium_andersonii.AAC.1